MSSVEKKEKKPRVSKKAVESEAPEKVGTGKDGKCTVKEGNRCELHGCPISICQAA